MPSEEDPLAHILLSTPLILAFLDHAPISRGHVLVATRQHRTKLSDMSVEEGQAIGAWIGVLSRAVVRAVEGKAGLTHATDSDIGDWNVVQNNGMSMVVTRMLLMRNVGARAAQVVPHVHFHIIPRTSDVPNVKARSWTIFGKGQRQDLDPEDAAELLGAIRKRIVDELDALARREGDAVVRQLLGGQDLGFLKPML